MGQRWRELLFAHWPLDPEVLHPMIPPGLTLDTWEGQAWIAVVPFRMRDVAPRFCPSVPWLSAFPELNVRTYVRYQDKPGVWFFSLEAANPLAVRIARQLFHLPYMDARMACIREGDAVRYRSHRTHAGEPPADLRMRYRPTGPVYLSRPGTLEHWLTERYCLYSQAPNGILYRGEIHHAPWPLQPAEAEWELNTLGQCHGLVLPDTEPLLHFVRDIAVGVWPLQKLP
jgi:uncharacterized protein YqjF (DUF2071 family)